MVRGGRPGYFARDAPAPMPLAHLNRRAFLHRSTAVGALASLAVRPAAARPLAAGGPVVVSTWGNFRANADAWGVLRTGGRALDAVERGVWVPEADPLDTSVGLGGLPDRDGRVTLDACIMDEHGGCGAVAALEHILHPISVARRVMERTPHVMLVGEGALAFALAEGFERVNLLTPSSERAWRAWLAEARYAPVVNRERHDTIGMLGLGADGHLSGACTTSGLAYKMHGRVGDSPIIGAGLFVDDEVGAATATGNGEEMIRTAAAHTVVEAMRHGRSPSEAAREAVGRIRRKMRGDPATMQAGMLALGRDGQVGGFALQPGFNFVVTVPDGTPAPVVEGTVTRREAVPGGVTYLVEAPSLAGG